MQVEQFVGYLEQVLLRVRYEVRGSPRTVRPLNRDFERGRHQQLLGSTVTPLRNPAIPHAVPLQTAAQFHYSTGSGDNAGEEGKSWSKGVRIGVNGTAAGVSEVRDPIGGRVADIRSRRCQPHHPMGTGDPFESVFGPLVW